MSGLRITTTPAGTMICRLPSLSTTVDHGRRVAFDREFDARGVCARRCDDVVFERIADTVVEAVTTVERQVAQLFSFQIAGQSFDVRTHQDGLEYRAPDATSLVLAMYAELWKIPVRSGQCALVRESRPGPAAEDIRRSLAILEKHPISPANEIEAGGYDHN